MGVTGFGENEVVVPDFTFVKQVDYLKDLLLFRLILDPIIKLFRLLVMLLLLQPCPRFVLYLLQIHRMHIRGPFFIINVLRFSDLLHSSEGCIFRVEGRMEPNLFLPTTFLTFLV